MRFGQFAEVNRPPRYSTGLKLLDPYAAMLSNRLTPAVAHKLLGSHYDAKANVYNELTSLSLWLVGLGYKPRNSTRQEKGEPQAMADLLFEVRQEIKDRNALALFGKLLEVHDMVPPPLFPLTHP